MDNMLLARHLINFYKSSFDNTFQALTIMQEQAEKMLQTFLLQNSWLPEEGRKLIKDWANIYQQRRAEFKDQADEHFRKVEDFLAKAEAEAT
ncbi:MAG TPA: hypothetical protein PKN70_08370 [Smithellaceae bacterium]|nr:hypothetical protein [Smithellaceae bacterium]